MRDIVKADELLVEVVRLLPGGDAVGVGGGDPEAAGIGRVHLVDQHHGAVGREAKLIFGIDQNQAAAARQRLPTA